MKNIVAVILFQLVVLCGMASGKDLAAQKMDIDSLTEQIKAKRQELDSINQRTNDLIKSMQEKKPAFDNTGLEMFMRQQKEREERERKQLWIRGGIFVVLLAVIIGNLIRRRKKTG